MATVSTQLRFSPSPSSPLPPPPPSSSSSSTQLRSSSSSSSSSSEKRATDANKLTRQHPQTFRPILTCGKNTNNVHVNLDLYGQEIAHGMRCEACITEVLIQTELDVIVFNM
ncbi:hypothetical protein HELRODRAFT_164338 [Helobdella robusta]|uniref:Uncharacterized protein n=1 Tax=Helobdella robusta TaxID=6412 RepID=T1EVA2_HELRO|nr:hypothetical protein HELRODRAFT_164338 [Helobdella robusta]ESN94484.1 hypothetical protein HELRODRAFT_164338 [Helobdella robusta]